MPAVIMSLVLIAIGVGWHFSCNDLSALCQTSKGFSIGAVLLGLLCLGISIFGVVLDRKEAGRRQPPPESQEDG